MADLGRFHNQLLFQGLNRSKSRDLIYLELWLSGPLSKLGLVTRLHQKVSKAVVYSNLNALLKAGVIEAVRPGTYELTDRFKQHHHYFWCRICAKRISFYDEDLEKSLNRLAGRRQLALEEHNLELSGLCASCQNDHTPQPNIGMNLRRNPNR